MGGGEGGVLGVEGGDGGGVLGKLCVEVLGQRLGEGGEEGVFFRVAGNGWRREVGLRCDW